MNGRVSFRQADLTRALKASRKAGISVKLTEILADGSIRLTHGQAEPDNAYNIWKERRDARSA